MLVRTYIARKNLSLNEISEALNNSDLTLTTKLTSSQINFLNQSFEDIRHQLPASKELLQLPSESKITNLPSSDLARLLTEQKDELALPEVTKLKTITKTKLVVETAQLAAITDHQIYQDTYEDTAKTLMVNETLTWLEHQKIIREQFKSNQMVRDLKQQKPNSKDLTSQLLESLDKDNAEFINQFLK